MTSPKTDSLSAPDLIKNYGVVAQYCADIYTRMANQTARAIADASQELGTGTYTLDDCYRTMNTLANIAFLGWSEIFASAVTVGGFQYAPTITWSTWYPVPGDQTCAHRVTLSPLSRSVSDDPISTTRLGLEAQRADATVAPCPNWVLPGGTTHFRLVLNQAGIHSGCYGGKAQIARLPDASGVAVPPTQLDVEVDV